MFEAFKTNARKRIFYAVRNSVFDLILLQETHSTNEDTILWKKIQHRAHCVKYWKILVFTDPYSHILYAVTWIFFSHQQFAFLCTTKYLSTAWNYNTNRNNM